ncbi:MAG: DUF5668 domain-containing protein [Bacteroidota bacterium]
MRERNFYRGEDFEKHNERRQRFRMLFGVVLAIIGVALMLRTMGILPHFDLDLSWPVILIIIGVLIGLKNNFRNNSWWILLFIGTVNLIPRFMIMGRPSHHYVWPAAIIVAGLAIAFRPRRHDRCHPHRGISSSINNSTDLAVDVTFGGKKEVVTSKDWKGGAISATFAGAELNLTQADFTDPSVVLDCRVSFGGVEIIVPSHWDIQNEISPSFGSVEDERTIQTVTTNDTRKVLILRGSVSFGSIEIKSY